MTRAVAALTLAAALGTAALAQPPAKETPKAKPAEPTEVKSFAVEHYSPTELSGALAQVWGKLPRKAGEAAKPMPKVAVNDRTKTLIAIGTKAELETLANILAAIDADPAKAGADGAPVFLIKLRYAPVQEALSALGSLDLGDHVLPLGQQKTLIVVPVSTACGAQVRQVIESLDKESAKPAPAKKPTN
jgi:hypothetical protein